MPAGYAEVTKGVKSLESLEYARGSLRVFVAGDARPLTAHPNAPTVSAAKRRRDRARPDRLFRSFRCKHGGCQ